VTALANCLDGDEMMLISDKGTLGSYRTDEVVCAQSLTPRVVRLIKLSQEERTPGGCRAHAETDR